jgi:hypothetical protein
MVSDKSSTIRHDDTSINASITESLPKEGTTNKESLDEEISIAVTAIDEKSTAEEPYTIFSKARLIQFLVITSLTAMLSPLTGSIYFPSVNQIESVSSINYETLYLSNYLLDN